MCLITSCVYIYRTTPNITNPIIRSHTNHIVRPYNKFELYTYMIKQKITTCKNKQKIRDWTKQERQ